MSGGLAGSRHLLLAAGHSWCEREYPSHQYCGALSRASRIFYFRNGGNEEVYLGSADLMPRNLNRRIEVLFPIGTPALVRRLRAEILDRYLSDDANARYMMSNGIYTRKPAGGAFDTQKWFLAQRSCRSSMVDQAGEFNRAAGAAESPKLPPPAPDSGGKQESWSYDRADGLAQ